MATELDMRQEMVWYGAQLHKHGLVAGTDGNLSCRLANDRILITPSGCSKGDLTENDPVIIDLGGCKISGSGSPSSEYKMHLAIYRACPEVNGIIHAHPPITTAFTVAGEQFPIDILPEGIISLSNMVWLDYATPSTDEVPRLMQPHLPDVDIFVLGQHGVTASGANLGQAYLKLETCEHQARIYLYARFLGQPRKLDPQEVERLRQIYGNKIV